MVMLEPSKTSAIQSGKNYTIGIRRWANWVTAVISLDVNKATSQTDLMVAE